MSTKKMWFGTKEKMQWINCPAFNAPTSNVGWGEGGTFLNGGAWSNSSKTSHKEYDLSWNLASAETINIVQDYASGLYGDGPFYFTMPGSESNTLPEYYAAPFMAAGSGDEVWKLKRKNYAPNPSGITTSGSTEIRVNSSANPIPTTATQIAYQHGTGETSTAELVTTPDGPILPDGSRAERYIRRSITAAKTGGSNGFFSYSAAPTSGEEGDLAWNSAYVRSSHPVTLNLQSRWTSSAGQVVGFSSSPVNIPANQWVLVKAPIAIATGTAVHIGWWLAMTPESVIPSGGFLDITGILSEKIAAPGLAGEPFFSFNPLHTSGDPLDQITSVGSSSSLRRPWVSKWSGSTDSRTQATDPVTGKPVLLVRETARATGIYTDPVPVSQPIAGQWVGVGFDVYPLTPEAASSMRVVIGNYNGATMDGSQILQTPVPQGRWTRVTHARKLLTGPTQGAQAIRALAWPNDLNSGAFLVKGAVISYMDSESSVRSAVSNSWDGSTEDTPVIRYVWDGLPNDSSSSEYELSVHATRSGDAPSLIKNYTPTIVSVNSAETSLPTRGAQYTLTANSEPVEFFVPGLPGEDLYFRVWGRYFGDSVGITVNGSFIRLLSSSSITALKIPDEGAYIKLVGVGTAYLYGMRVSTDPTNEWKPGRGHSGCAMTEKPSVNTYSAGLDLFGMSARLTEVGAWL